MNINDEIIRFKHIELELKTDLDEILDVINEINERKKDKNAPPEVIKFSDESLERYKALLKQYSGLLLSIEKSIRTAEAFKNDMEQG